MFRGMAKLKGKNGSHYLLSFSKGESPASILKRAGDFYGTDMESVLNLRYREGDTLDVELKPCQNCDQLQREGNPFCSDKCSEEARFDDMEGDWHNQCANADIYPRF